MARPFQLDSRQLSGRLQVRKADLEGAWNLDEHPGWHESKGGTCLAGAFRAVTPEPA
jgi:hypothetical protein